MVSKRAVTWVILASVLAMSFAYFSASAPTDDLSKSPYVSSQVIVRFKDVISSEQIGVVEDFGGIVIDRIDALNLVLVQIAEERISALIDNLQRRGLVEYVERNYVDELLLIPNDPDWNLQWNMPIIEADRAWDVENGSDTVLVAVVDSGVDYDHPDLADNYQSGGSDWSNDDDDPYPDEFYEYRDHGTHVAGIIAAVSDNGEGVAGLAQVRILAEKAFGTGPYSGSLWAMAQAFEHATDLGASVISYSAAGTDSATKYDAVRYAYDRDVLIVAAAGNDNTNNPADSYPAAYDEVVSVAATNINDEKAGYSNWGDWIEISAPGGDGNAQVYSTIVDNYGYMSGTSMATPHVSGVAALIWSQFPESSRDQVRSLLQSSADDLGYPGWDEYYGYGRVNAYRAVAQSNVTFETNPTSFIDSAGTITFEGGTYSDGQSDSFSLANHTATANAPTDYTFFFWSYSGSPGSGVYVPNIGDNPTTVQVYGDGWLKAVFAAKVTFYTDPSNVGGIRWGSPSDPSHPNGDSIYDEALPPDYPNQIDVYADVPSGHKFDSWDCTGGLSPSTTSDPHTNVTFTGPGTITVHFTYDANITAYCVTEEQEVNVSFTWDTVFYSTPHLFTDLSGSHEVVVPQNDEGGHPFIKWIKDGVDYSTNRTITISIGGNYTAIFAEKYEIHLESMEQDTGTTTNLGSITFDATTHSLPKDISKEAGSYQATYDPVFGYRFDHWETSGGVSVAEAYAQATTVTVGGDGYLRANYTANISPTTPAVTSPDGGEIWSGTHDITWTASTDANGDPITYEIQYSTDAGTTWLDLASGISGTFYPWDTTTYSDSTNCLARVKAYDGELYSGWDQSSSVFTVDNTPPSTIHSLEGTIGEGGWWNSSVQVTLSASDGTSGVDYADYEIDGGGLSRYTGPFTISGDGVHTVEYYSVDNAEPPNTESAKFVEIKIDTVPPEGSITIAGGAEYATSTSVTLSLTYSDATSGVYQVRYSNDGDWDTEAWESPAPTKAWTLTPGDGTKTVYYQVKDDAGWVSITYFDTIILDTTPPTGSIMINDGAPYTNSTSVTLTLSATDAVEMRFSNDNVTYTDWEPYDTSKSWILPAGDGEKTVYVKFKDNAGLISSYSDTIILDTTPPTITDHTPTGSDVPVTTTVTVTFSEAVNQTSVESAFSIDPPVSGLFSWSGDTMTFTPLNPLEYTTTYNVTIGTGAEDLGGNNLQSPHSWQFTTSAATITITKLQTNRRIYTAGQNILIYAWIEEDGSPLTVGTVTAKVYAKGKPNVLLATLEMNYNPATGRWEATYGPIPGHEDPDGYQGTYAIKVTAKHPPATKATKIVRRFVAYRRRQGVEARFTRAVSPSVVPTNQNFMVKVAIKNPSDEAQTLTVKLILPSGVNLIDGQLQQDITLGAGEKITLKWTLESTTTTNKRMKINVLKGGSVVAKLHWYIRAEPTSATTSLASPTTTLATAAIVREHQARLREDIQQRKAQNS